MIHAENNREAHRRDLDTGNFIMEQLQWKLEFSNCFYEGLLVKGCQRLGFEIQHQASIIIEVRITLPDPNSDRSSRYLSDGVVDKSSV